VNREAVATSRVARRSSLACAHRNLARRRTARSADVDFHDAVTAPLVIAATVQQIKSMVLVMRLCSVELREPYGEVARDVFGDLEHALERLVAVSSRAARSASAASGPEVAASGCYDLTQFVRGASRRYARLFEPDITFHLELPEQAAPVDFPARLLERIVLDLLMRARDVSPPSSLVALRVERGDDFARVSVSDAGSSGEEPGVDLMAFWTKVLGLGNVTLQSRPGQGSSFSITLPLLAQAD